MNNLSLKVIFSALDKVSAPFNAMSKSASSLSGDLAKAKSELSALERQAKTVDAWKKNRGELVRTSNALESASKELAQARTAFEALEKPTKEQTINEHYNQCWKYPFDSSCIKITKAKSLII